MFRLALGSLWNRRFVALLTIGSIALSVALILGVERLRSEARQSFANSASGIDLIVAARGSPIQILMATVFGVGSTDVGLQWDTFTMVEHQPGVAWAVPLQMGDNHHGYPVVGTTVDYFQHFRHSGGQALVFAAGQAFAPGESDGAVVGAEVAARFGYHPGAVIINAHGAGEVAFDLHDDAPFTIRGVLAPTGTAVDRMVLVSLAGFDTLHAQRQAQPLDPFEDPPEVAPTAAGEAHHHEPQTLNAILVGLTDRGAVLGLQRALANYPHEAITVVLPNVALLELWSITGTAETALRLMASAVALAGMTGMIVMLSATLEARRREFAILRAVGATPTKIFALILIEALLLTAAGIAVGLGLLSVGTLIADPLLYSRYGLRMGLDLLHPREGALLAATLLAGFLAALVPAFRVYRVTLADGLSPRI